MLFRKQAMEKEVYWSIHKCIDDNMYLYEEELERAYASHELRNLANAAIVVIEKINELAINELESNKVMSERYQKALANPSLCGYEFDTPRLTIGKIYLFFIWAFWGKKGSKTNCKLLDEYFLSQLNAKRNDFLNHLEEN